MRRDVSDVHTFVVCAYKESPYLRECVESLLAQTVKSTIIMVTSTPCGYIENIASEYNIPLYVNEGEKGISADWNFGMSRTHTKYVTLAHQDDIYRNTYTVECIHSMEKDKRPLIYFTDYGEIRNGIRTDSNRLLKVKRLMLFPLGIKIGGRNIFAHSVFVRRRILSLGNPICCPSVTFNRELLGGDIFRTGMKSNVDWEAWEMISRKKGAFLYDRRRLTYHRIHEESTTTELIADNGRTQEDYHMFCIFWPKWIASILIRWYSDSQKSNAL